MVRLDLKTNIAVQSSEIRNATPTSATNANLGIPQPTFRFDNRIEKKASQNSLKAVRLTVWLVIA